MDRTVLYLLRSQFIPVISEDPSVNVVNFVRTAMWFVSSVSLSLEKYVKTHKCPAADRSLFWNYEMGVFLHPVCSGYPSLFDRGNSMSYSKRSWFETDSDLILSTN
jgi:hypothetical protein